MKSREQRKKEKKQHDIEKREKILKSRFPLVMNNPKPQKCGDCQACCEVIAIGEDQDDPAKYKPNYVKCQHQCKEGCGIYHTRPDECKNYYCLYLIGALNGGEEMRPDRLGVLIDFRPNATGIPTLVFWEVRPEALSEPKVRQLIHDIKRKHPAFVLARNDYRFNYKDSNLEVTDNRPVDVENKTD